MELTRDLLLDSERRLLLESVSGFRTAVLEEAAREMDESPAAGSVEKAWKGAGPTGLTAALVSAGAGGQGMDTYSFCLALAEVARASAGFGLLLLSHNLALWACEKAGPGELIEPLGPLAVSALPQG